MKKNNSILFQMCLRAGISVLYFGALFLLSSKIFNIGSIDDIGLENGLVLLVLGGFLMIMLMLSSESTSRYSDPINVLNHKKYKCIMLVEIGNYLILWFFLMNYEISLQFHMIFNLISYLSLVGVLAIHMLIIGRYKKMMYVEIQDMISSYRIGLSEEVLQKCSEVKMQTYKFFGYLVAVEVLFEYLVLNIATSVVFLVGNIIIIIRLFKIPLKEMYSLLQDKNSYKKAILFGVLSSSIGYIGLNLIFKGYIDISIFKGWDAADFGMIFIIFYAPLYHYLIKAYNLEIRAQRIWEQ